MISSTPRHCWKSAGWATQSSVTRPLVCWARRAAKRTATLDSGVLSTTTRNLRGRSISLMPRFLHPPRAAARVLPQVEKPAAFANTARATGQRADTMTIESEEQLENLKRAGVVVAATMRAMAAAMEPGMTTRELDALGRALLEREGARSAPETTYKFPGATCISVLPAIAHGIPGDQILRAGDLVNIDVSADIDGYYADTGGSFAIPPVTQDIETLCRDGKRAMWAGIHAVKGGGKLNAIGRAVQEFADKNRYTLIRNLASHGVGGALHEEPGHIPTWYEPGDRRRIAEGLVFTIEPFLSTGSHTAVGGDYAGTLFGGGGRPTVQYEHPLV